MTFNDNYFRLLNFIKSTNIVLTEQFNKYCENIGITDAQRGNFVKILVNKREMFIGAGGAFYTSSPDIPISKLTPALEKAIWFFVHNCDKYSYCNFAPKPPANAYICGESEDGLEELTVFYIPEGTEKIQSRIIETNYGIMPSSVPTLLIVSSINSLENVILSDAFVIKNIVLIDNKGEITYLM